MLILIILILITVLIFFSKTPETFVKVHETIKCETNYPRGHLPANEYLFNKPKNNLVDRFTDNSSELIGRYIKNEGTVY
jgi:hypothetical protein